MALGSGSGVSPSWEVVDSGPVVEVGPLVIEAAVSIREEEVVLAGLDWVSSML